MSKDNDLWHIEEAFHSKDAKSSRKERKRISLKDRSKYKKSDQDQQKNKLEASTQHLLCGRVLAILPEGALVCCEEEEFLCTLKGSLKHDTSRVKNLLAVGDFVRFEKNPGAEQGCIVKVEERRSILSRADNLSRSKEQLIAVNVDQVLITASILFPPLKPFLIDRYIIAAQKGNMEPIILINKVDYLHAAPKEIDAATVEQEIALYQEFLSIYQGLHFKVIPISVETGIGIEELKAAMHGKTSVFSGQSGVGKSSLINLVTSSSLTTGSVVQRTRKGSHTTTRAHLIPLAGGGFCIDTPGIKSFGLWDLQPADIASYFSEIHALSPQCKYPDCSHLNEPHCAVKAAVEEHTISSLRYASYCALMASVSEEHKQR